jgi:hypothetical protein
MCGVSVIVPGRAVYGLDWPSSTHAQARDTARLVALPALNLHRTHEADCD